MRSTVVKNEAYLSPCESSINKKTLDDYLTFFTQPSGADMLPYVYMESSLLYNNLIKNCKDYYLCIDEVQVINKNTSKLNKHLHDVTDIIEIGPGSIHAVQNKTLPILSCATNLKCYHGVDYSENYLKDACNYMDEQRSDLNILRVETDLAQLNCFNFPNAINKHKAILFLGSTLGNFRSLQQNNIIKQFSNITNVDDLLILTIDTNQDKESLLKAYDNLYFHKFVMASLEHYAKLNPTFKKHLSSFVVKVEIDEALNSIDAFFLVKKNLSFDFPNYGKITLSEGQKLRGIISHKPSQEMIISLLYKYNFNVLEILNNSDRMKIFICKRN